MQTHGKQLDLLLTDVVMPNMSGADLASHVHMFHPHLKILYISGYAVDALTKHGLPPQQKNLLVKPFTARQIADAVQRTLSNDRQG